MIAEDQAELHGGAPRIDAYSALNEKGQEMSVKEHDIVTGSMPDGRLATLGADGQPRNMT